MSDVPAQKKATAALLSTASAVGAAATDGTSTQAVHHADDAEAAAVAATAAADAVFDSDAFYSLLQADDEIPYTVAPDDAAELDEWVSKLQGEGVSVAGTPKPKRSKRHKGGAPVAAPGGRGRSRQA